MDNMTLQTVDRALSLLEMIAEQPGTQQELERKTGLNRTTITRLLQTLARRHYIEKDGATNVYTIGLKVVEISSIKLNQIELKTEAVPLLRELSQKLNQVCHMGTLSQGEVVYIEKIEPMTSIRMFSAIGKRVPVHSTSLGKVLVSDLPDDAIRRILQEKGMHSFTEHTITREEQYLVSLEEVRKNGYAVDDAENESGIFCIAAPVRDYRNQIVAAISSTGNNRAFLLPDSREIALVKNTAYRISRRMGYNRAV